MEKLFTLTEKHWQTGISQAKHIEDGGILYQAKGINPYIGTSRPTTITNSGLLQSASSAVDISDNLADDVWSGVIGYRNSLPALFMQGDGGHFYEQNIVSDGVPTDLRSATPITDPASGIGIYQAVNGSLYVYYAQKTKIGRWDVTGGATYPTYWTDNYIGSGGTINTTNIVSTTIHPMHNFAGSLWMGNGNSVAKITDNGSGGVSFDASALDLPADYLITSLTDDGRYLVITATKNTVGGTFWPADTSIYFWDLISNSWSREWKLFDGGIASLRNVNGSLYALGVFALYAFDYSTSPFPVLLLGTNENIGGIGVSPTHHLATDLNGVLYWNANGVICSFGSLLPGKPKAFFQPHVLPTTDYNGTFLIAGQNNRFYAANTNSDLYYLTRTTGGNTGVSASTVYVPTPAKVQLQRIDIILGTALASGDSLSVQVQRDDATTAFDWGTVSFTKYGAVRKVSLYNSMSDVDYLSLIFNFDAGNVKIKSVVVYGEAMET